MPKRNIAILLANGGHARLLRRDHESGDFHTVVAVEDGPSGHSPTPDAGGTDQREHQRRLHAFLEVIALHTREAAREHALDGLVLVAQPRILADLTAALEPICPVLAGVQKDMTKAKDHELAHLLAGALLQAEGALRFSA